jgi:hypothetical protein
MRPFTSRAVLFAISLALAACGGGGGSGTTASNPAPSISSISPSSAQQSGASFTLSITGTGFITSSVVHWGSGALTTSYISTTALSATVLSSDLSSVGTAPITVVNPAPGGGVSNALDFNISKPAPLIGSLQPASIMVNAPQFTLTVKGVNFQADSVVQWNGASLATAYGNSTTLTATVPADSLTEVGTALITVSNPSGNTGASTAQSFAILAHATYVQMVNIDAYNIVWDNTHARIYASTTDTEDNSNWDASVGHNVVAVDPATGQVGTSVNVGNGTNPLAISSDDSLLYVGLDIEGRIARLNLPDLSIDRSFSISFPASQVNGQEVALSLAASPQNPHWVAASLGTYSISPSNLYGLAVFGDGLPNTPVGTDPYPALSDEITWGADDTTLFAADTASSKFELKVFSVSPDAALTDSAAYSQDFYLGGALHFDSSSGFVYLDGGWVIDPATGNTVDAIDLTPLGNVFDAKGHFESPLCLPDASLGVVFYIGKTDAQYSAAVSGLGVTILAFDIHTHKLLQTLTLPDVAGYPSNFIRWGRDGLAFNVISNLNDRGKMAGALYLVNGSFIDIADVPASFIGNETDFAPVEQSISPESATAGSTGFTLTVTGHEFTSDTVVLWNGLPLQTIFTSTTELQASVPAANVASAGTAQVTLTDSANGNSSAIPLVFSIFPADMGSTSIASLNLASMNIAWDAKSGFLYLPVLSTDPLYANSVVAVDPITGNIVHSASVASDPYAITTTTDGAYLYSGFLATNSLVRLSLPNLDSGVKWSLPVDTTFGPTWAFDIQPQPGRPQTIAVTLANSGGMPPPIPGGIEIYDDQTPRPQAPTPSYYNYGLLQWGAGGNVLYAWTGFSNLTSVDVNPSGFGTADRQFPALGSSTDHIHFDSSSGYLFSDSGVVYDPVAQKIVASLGFSGLVTVDPVLNRVFIIGQPPAQVTTRAYTIQSFDKTTFAPISSITISPLPEPPVAFVRWGSHGLAIVTNGHTPLNENLLCMGENGLLYILNDVNFVSSLSHPTNTQPNLSNTGDIHPSQNYNPDR